MGGSRELSGSRKSPDPRRERGARALCSSFPTSFSLPLSQPWVHSPSSLLASSSSSLAAAAPHSSLAPLSVPLLSLTVPPSLPSSLTLVLPPFSLHLLAPTSSLVRRSSSLFPRGEGERGGRRQRGRERGRAEETTALKEGREETMKGGRGGSMHCPYSRLQSAAAAA